MKQSIFTKKIMTVFCMTMLYCLSGIAQDKNVIWVHGLSGNAESWENYRNYFDNYQGVNANNTYVEYPMTGIVNGAEVVRGQIATNLGAEAHDADNNIYISHSMGGIIGRQLHGTYAETPYFNNMITCSAQHEGAPISTSIHEGEFEAYLAQGCEELLAAPSSYLIGLNSIYMPKVCEWMSGIAAATFGDDYINPSLSDIQPGTPFMNEVVNLPTPSNKVGCIAIEDSPIHWRQITSAAVPFCKVENLNLNQTRDNVLVNVMSFARTSYAFSALLNNVSSWISMMPWKRRFYSRNAAKWKRGKDWIDGSEEGWNLQIGALTLQTVTITTDGFHCQDALDEIYATIESVEDGTGPINSEEALQFEIDAILANPDCYGPITTTTTGWVLEESDGIVPVSSQTFPDTPYNFEMRGVNHQEARNHPNATIQYRKLLIDGQAGKEFRINFE